MEVSLHVHQEIEAHTEKKLDAFANTDQVGASSRINPIVLVQLLFRPAGRNAILSTHSRAGQ